MVVLTNSDISVNKQSPAVLLFAELAKIVTPQNVPV